MQVETLDAVIYSIMFLLPGYVFSSTYHMFVPSAREDSATFFLRYLLFSFLNFCLWFWLIHLVVDSGIISDSPFVAILVSIEIVIISPTLLAIGAAWLSQRGVLMSLLERLGLRPMHAIPASWDYLFGGLRQVTWMLVTLKDGEKIAGMFGPHSFASSDPEERDLFLEDVYTIDDDGVWHRSSPDAAILISGSEIKCIELWANQEEIKDER